MNPIITAPPTEAEYTTYSRWAIPPLATRRQYWVEQEAQAISIARTGRTDPFPTAADFAAAHAIIPAEV